MRAAIEHAHRVGLEFTLPWHQALLGYVHSLNGEFESAVLLLETALERSREIHLPYLTSSTAARLGETLALRDPKRALDVAEPALDAARASGFRALEAELLRMKASALLSLDYGAAEAAANNGYALAQELGLGPEQAHGLRTLGDIMAAKGDKTKADELHNLAPRQISKPRHDALGRGARMTTGRQMTSETIALRSATDDLRPLIRSDPGEAPSSEAAKGDDLEKKQKLS